MGQLRIVLAPDSFKGTMTAAEVCEAMERGMRQELPEAEFDRIPMADGGEGTIEAIVSAARGQIEEIEVAGPLGESIRGTIGRIEQDGERWAIVEAASLFGLPMLAQEERNPLNTTSRGMGDAIRFALDSGFRKLVIGLGGSATNDGGMGMLSALGARYFDSEGRELYGFGRDMASAERADFTKLDPRLPECSLIIASDVTNPLLGPQGATRVYGPQKGASQEVAEELESAMGKMAALTERELGVRCADSPGAGAAGGLGFALMAIGAMVKPGAEVVGDLCGLEERIRRADCVVTGEGSSDAQTLFGKLPIRVAEVAKTADKPAYLLSGSLGGEWTALLPHFAGCLSTVTRPAPLEEIMRNAERNLLEASRNLARLIAASRNELRGVR